MQRKPHPGTRKYNRGGDNSGDKKARVPHDILRAGGSKPVPNPDNEDGSGALLINCAFSGGDGAVSLFISRGSVMRDVDQYIPVNPYIQEHRHHLSLRHTPGRDPA
jgi:hypothetical protein